MLITKQRSKWFSHMVPLIISSPAETVVQIEPDRSCPIYCNNSLWAAHFIYNTKYNVSKENRIQLMDQIWNHKRNISHTTETCEWQTWPTDWYKPDQIFQLPIYQTLTGRKLIHLHTLHALIVSQKLTNYIAFWLWFQALCN